MTTLALLIAVVAATPAVPKDNVTALTRKLAALEVKVADLEAQLIGLQMSGYSVDLDASGSADANYYPLRCSVGTLLLSFSKAEPYLDGQRLTLRIGNPTSASLRGFSFTIRWGKRRPADNSKWYAWYLSLQRKTVRFTDTLAPGRWGSVDVVVSPADAGDLGSLDISDFTLDGIILQ
jgi:hypothetical protein